MFRAHANIPNIFLQRNRDTVTRAHANFPNTFYRGEEIL
jgi:hypothetical protein